VEIGVESYNADVLKYYNKPQRLQTINSAVKILHKQSLKIIPNIIIGLLYEDFTTYANTIKWLFENRKKFYMINIYNYAVYADASLGVDSDIQITADDTNELATKKSFHTSLESFAAKNASDAIFTIALEIL
jgi:coproporphyrinogen III oxidase-like Fe-S oxidoreductase